LAYAARLEKISVVGFAGVVADVSEKCSPSSFPSEQTRQETSKALFQLLGNCLNESVPLVPNGDLHDESVSEESPESSLSESQLEYENSFPTQGSAEQLNGLLSAVQSQLNGAEVAHGIVVFGQFFEVLKGWVENLKIVSTAESLKEPHAPFYQGQVNGKPVLIVHQTLFHSQGYPLSQVVSSVKVLAKLVEKVFLFTPAVSTSGPVDVGEVVRIKDHVNVSSRNPLYGEQIEGWGIRFPDMSSTWTQGKDAAFRNVNLAVVVGPIFCSPLEASFAKNVAWCDVSAPGVGYEAVSLKHVKPHINLTGFGVVIGDQTNVSPYPSLKALSKGLESVKAQLDLFVAEC